MSLFGNFLSLIKKFSQSLLSLSEILSFNYVKVSTNCQFGLLDLVSLENTHVSYIFLIFSGSPEITFLFLSFIQVITSLTKSTVTFKILSIFLFFLIFVNLFQINLFF